MKNLKQIAVVTSIHKDFDARIWKHCKSLSKMGYSVNLICPWDIYKGEQIEDIKFYSFKRIWPRLIRFVLVPFLVLGKLLKVIKHVDIIHFHDIDLLPLMTIISLFNPVVYDVHENYPDEMIDREWIPKYFRKPLFHLVRWIQNSLSKIIKNLVLVTPEQLVHFDKEKLNSIIIWNYASLSLLSDVIDDYMQRPDTIVFTGGGYRSNGTYLLLEIAENIKKVYPHVKFIIPDIFTTSAFEKECKEFIIENNLKDTVKFFRPVPSSNIMNILNKGTIGLLPNQRVRKNEIAVPQKLFEYMAAGLPIVSSDLPYLKENFSKYDIGFLAEPEKPQSFVVAIIKLIENRKFAYQLGKNAKIAFATEYNWESQMPSLHDYYSGILNN